ILRLGMVDMRLETGDAQASSVDKKKLMEQTRVIPKGVTLDQLVSTQPLDVSKTGFEKKSNKANLVFIIGACVVGAVLVLALVYVIFLKPPAAP
ncbi:MAG TPA: hypothetical protein VJ063_03840, partial [Verrucomicrobiae bacterium]|nr:hypothetical protein [Verrucomicrobiae bacterium]